MLLVTRLFVTNHEANKYYMSSGASTESVFTWMLSLVLFVFYLSFLFVIYVL